MASKATSTQPQPQDSASGSTLASPSNMTSNDHSNPMSTIINGGTGRILCVSDIRGDYNNLNKMIEENKAVAVIHTGDFGFLDGGSPSRMMPRISRHLLNYTPLLDSTTRTELLAIPHGPALFSRLDPSPSSPSSFKLSQLGLLLSGDIKFSCPVYTVYGPVEDVRVLEKFRTGEYEVDNLFILDEALTRSLEVGGIKLRLFGLGGGVQMHKMFDNGEGTATIAGGNGTIWATALQIGELVDTAERVFDPSETRLLVTHGAYGRDGLLAQLAMVLKTDLTISGALHFRFISSFNEFGVQTDQESFKNKLLKSRNSFMEVYESAKVQLDSSISADQKEFLQKAVQVAQKVVASKADEEDPYWKNCWHWSLSEAAYGHMVMSVKDGRVSAETFSQGLNFGYRRFQKAGRQVEAPAQVQTNTGTNTPVPANKSVNPPSGQAGQTRQQPVQPRKVNNNSVETKPAPAQTSSTPAPPKLSNPTAPATVNPPSNNAPAQAPAKPTPTGPSKHSETPIPSSTNSAPVPQRSQQQQQQQSQQREQNQSQQNQSQTARPERKTSNRFEKGEGKDRESREPREPREPRGERGTERERENPWTKANGGESTERAGKKIRGPKPLKEGKEQATSPSDGFKTVGSKKDLNNPEVASKPDSDKENAPESSEPVDEAKKVEAEDGPSRINGEKAPRTPFNPYSLYIKGLPTDVTQDNLKTIFDEAIRAKITRMKIPLDQNGNPKRFAYVEFGNDEDLQAALNKHEDALNGSSLNITISNPPTTSSFRGGRGGFNGSRGGRGGGFGGRGGFRPGFNKPTVPSS